MAAPSGASNHSVDPFCNTCSAKSHGLPSTSMTRPRSLAPSRGQSALDFSLTCPVGSGRQNIPVQPGRCLIRSNSSSGIEDLFNDGVSLAELALLVFFL